MNLVWLEPPRMAKGFRAMAQKTLNAKGIRAINVRFVCLTENCLIKKTKTKFTWDQSRTKQFYDQLAELQPDFIFVNDKAALGYITGKYISLALCRGGVYKCEVNGRLVPAIVIDDLYKTKTLRHGSWAFVSDIAKAQRWISGTVRKEANFAYKVCTTINDVMDCSNAMKDAYLTAIDIETTGTTIASMQYSVLQKSGKIFTWVIPLVNPSKPNGCHWNDEQDEVMVWNIVRKMHDFPCYKVLQNGSYDSVYFIISHAPLRNYVADTMHGWHAIWMESPKRLDFIASIAMDTYQYWKDEGKEDAKEDDNGRRIPSSVEGLENYWRYGALDTHNTLHVWLFILQVLTAKHLKWALNNYRIEMRQQFGPALAMTMRGTKCNETLQMYFTAQLQTQSDNALQELRIAADSLDYNPGSPKQNLEILYDVLGLKPYGKKGRTTDEKILTMIKDQNIFADWFIEKMWECKKPANNVSKYGKGVTLNGRFMYKMGAANTDTGRYGSRGHDLWVGNNIQNMPYLMRPMLEADEGYVLFDIDYAQSDAYFTAFDLQEEKMIEVMLSDDDTHCVHAAFFFKMAYDELYAAHKKKEDWVSHNQTGVRSITKRIVYGANYLMAGNTLLITMTREPVIAAAKQLGYADAHTWTDKKLAKLCDAFLAKYFQMYPGLKPALEQAMIKAAANGNTYTAAFGRTRMFFGALSDNATQRAFAAYIGQAGTAGNINTAMDKLYYGYEDANGTFRQLEKEGAMLLFQVHDSLVGQVPNSRLDLIPEIELAMQNECELHGRKFVVPTEADCGLGWGKRLMKYHNGITLDEIKVHDSKWWAKWQRGECV